jgi:hypothetical protein
MPTLSELQYQAFSTNSGTTGTLNEVTYAYLAQVTGLSGISLQEQWAAALATNGFAVGTVNERQMAYWASLGYSGNWNERFYQWLSDGGAFGPNVLIQPQGTVPTVGYCDYAPAGNCTATRQYLAVDSGFTNPADQWVWSIEPPVTGVSVSAGQGTNTCTVSTTNLDVDTAFNLKVVATDTVSTDSAERTSAQEHFHREDLAVTIGEETNPGCVYDSGGGSESGCVSIATYKSNNTGTPTSYSWVLSDITGGTATLTAGQGTANVTIQTSGGTPEVSYKLTLDATSEFQSAQDSQTFTQTKTDSPTPVFIGPDIDTTQLVEDVLMTPFDVSGRFTGETAGNYVLVGTWPTGVSIDANGVLSGTPAGPAADYTNLQFQAGNANGDTLSNAFTVQVVEGASLQPPVFIGPDLGGAIDVGVPLSEDLRLRFSGDTANYTNTGNALPSGLSLDPSGIITGTPDTSGIYTGLQFTATNAAGSDTTNTFTFTVWEDIVFAGPDIGPLTFTVNTPFSLDVSGTFTGTVESYSLGGTWPPGFAIDNSGVITGTATVEASYTGLSVTASNTKPDSAVSNTFNGDAQEDTGPAFWALTPDETTYEMLGVKTGTGDLTTTHTSSLYAPDYNGTYRPYGANDAVWSGCRLVVNYAPNSDHLDKWLTFSGDITSGITDPDGGTTAYTLTATGGGGAVYLDNVLPDGVTTIHSWWIRRRTGVGNVRIYNGQNFDLIDISSAVDGTWKRITVTGTGGDGIQRIGVALSSSGDEVDVWHPQSEALSATAIPSEYISTSAAVGGNLLGQDVGDWSTSNTTITDEGAYFEVTATGASNPKVSQDLPVLIGRHYQWEAELYSPAANSKILGRLTAYDNTSPGAGEYLTVSDTWVPLVKPTDSVTTASPSLFYVDIADNVSYGTTNDVVRFRNPSVKLIDNGYSPTRTATRSQTT